MFKTPINNIHIIHATYSCYQDVTVKLCIAHQRDVKLTLVITVNVQ